MHMLRNHLHAAAFTMCSLFLGASIALSIAAESSETRLGQFLDAFQIVGTDNTVDLAAIIGHPCYDTVGIEAQMCEETYGLTESLHSTIESGKVYAYFASRGIIDRRLLPPSAQASGMSSSSTASSLRPRTGEPLSQYQRTLTQRGKLLWDTCQRHYTGRDAYRCYARNTSILARFDVPIQGNIH